MEKASSSKTAVIYYQTARCHVPEDFSLHQQPW